MVPVPLTVPAAYEFVIVEEEELRPTNPPTYSFPLTEPLAYEFVIVER